ncbi:hypothetical protein GS8_3231 [Geobacillus stearothermophilus]|uniref:Uncharacterized protein n=1 Tax=Geobacillus stearothermophilus TaxID=1422 RepID=A0ABQ7HB31_GEOSE|nr:hypothetical protein GS8_3231 [Geobacillus stearothermophilus]
MARQCGHFFRRGSDSFYRTYEGLKLAASYGVPIILMQFLSYL